MTIEEKAKAYDNIIQRVTELYETGTSLTVEQMEHLFPELRVNEDERIRKSLIGLVEQFMADERKEKTLAYLEKIKDTEYNNCDFVIYHPLENEDGVYECIPYSFYGSLTSFSDAKDLMDFLHTCFSTEQECKEWIESHNGLRMGDFAMNRFVGFFEKKAKEYEINLPRRGYDIYALCAELYTFLRSQSLDTIERMTNEINARTVKENSAHKQGLIYLNNNNVNEKKQ